MKPSALIVDDDARHAESLSDRLQAHGFAVQALDSVEEARALPANEPFDVAFLTLHCNGQDGLALIEHPAVAGASEIILMNAVDEPDRVNHGIAAGATYFFCKPFDKGFIDSILADLAAEASAGSDPDTFDFSIDQFALLRGGSPAMRKLYRIMRKVAAADTSVLLIGESGTGKELVAQSLHLLGNRADRDFVAMNCAAIPKELFESELFGHEKGSFSGALRQHQGYFERAHQATLFLDEITEMPAELQAKLLRVLELGEFRRVGGEQDLYSDVRIIAATNRDPDEAIADGNLREDLFYRIARFPLWIPPLRDRDSDIIGLTLFFLNELNTAQGSAIGISEPALERIREYPWPGNVRELRSVIEQAYIMANEEIGPAELKALDDPGPDPGDYIRVSSNASVEEAEKKLILAALDSHAGDKQAAAESLGISLKTLYNRLNEYSTEQDQN